MAKKETKKAPKKAKAKAEEKQMTLKETIVWMFGKLDEIDNEYNRFEEKGISACLGRIRKHLQEMKKQIKPARDDAQQLKEKAKAAKGKDTKKKKK